MSKKISQWVAEAKVDPVGAYRRRKVHCDRLASGGHGGRRAGKSHMRDFLKGCQAAGIDMTGIRAASEEGQSPKIKRYVAFVAPQRSASSAATWPSDPKDLRTGMLRFVSELFPNMPTGSEPIASAAHSGRRGRSRAMRRAEMAPYAGAMIFHQITASDARKLSKSKMIALVPDRKIKASFRSTEGKFAEPRKKQEFVAASTATVGVIDSGIDGQHPEFNDVSVEYRVFARNEPTKTSVNKKDFGSHGTHICSLIAGNTCGYAPGSKLLVAAALTLDQGSAGYLADIVEAFDWIAEQSPLVINMSLQFDAIYEDLRPSIKLYTFQSGVVVAACGNKETSRLPGAPGAYPETLSVGAQYWDGENWEGTATGTVIFADVSVQKPDVWSYGVDVYGAVPGARYESRTGTSMASAIYAAMLANGKTPLTTAQIRPSQPLASV